MGWYAAVNPDGTIVNIFESEDGGFNPYPDTTLIPATEDTYMGQVWDGEKFVTPERVIPFEVRRNLIWTDISLAYSNNLEWYSLTPEEQNELLAYRRALKQAETELPIAPAFLSDIVAQYYDV